jgi:diguanylate cyclase (GGDEF)-like protein/PAS domain S-box-containing protein
VTGYSAAEVLGENPRLLKSGDKDSAEYRELWETILAGQVWRGQFHNRRKDGTIFWESASISPVRDAEGALTHFIAVKEDITVRKRVEDQLRLNATVFDTIGEGILVTDALTRIKTVNPAFTRITGYEPEEVVGRSPSILASGRHDAAFYRELWGALRRTGYWSGEIWNRRKDGRVYPEWLSLAAIRDPQGEIQEYVGVFSDITRRKQDEEQIRRQANYDALTGLPNRTLLVDRLARALAAAHREELKVALLFVDLDRFKGVNDSLGHAVGDELLQQVAGRLRDCLRETDTVARFGGDEFVVMLEGVRHANDAAQVAKKLIADLERPFALVGREVFIGASVGITLYPDDSQDADNMLRNADMAMYRAKDAGRNTYQFFTLTMNEEVQARIELERDLRQALERGQLCLHWQPIVSAVEGRMVAAEALLRWEHPARGQVPPGLFVPLAEDTGLIGPIGRWVMGEAMRQCAQWQREGLRIRANVNLSSRQLALGLEVAELQSLLAESGAEPAWLALEITETLMLDGSLSTLRWLEQVRALGIGLSVDDFGTGYSSLSYLKRYPMDSLKIDRAFVNGLPGDREDASLVQAILALARSLGLKVVAEGVETEAQWHFLRAKGCTLMQGWLFSKAVEPGLIPELARRRWPPPWAAVATA